MEHTDSPQKNGFSLPQLSEGPAIPQLRLYVARATPNSVRAESNLATVLETLAEGFSVPSLEVIDVFLHPKRAITEGVVVTPTLIGSTAGRRFVLMGDLADQINLRRCIQELIQLA